MSQQTCKVQLHCFGETYGISVGNSSPISLFLITRSPCRAIRHLPNAFWNNRLSQLCQNYKGNPTCTHL